MMDSLLTTAIWGLSGDTPFPGFLVACIIYPWDHFWIFFFGVGNTVYLWGGGAMMIKPVDMFIY